MKTILFLSKSFDSPSTRYRALAIFPALYDSGYIASHITLNKRGVHNYAYALWAAKSSDVVVVLRKTFPSFYLKALRFVSKFLIFDFDDAIFVKSNGQESKSRTRRFRHIVGVSDQVVCGNAFLVQYASQFNAKTLLIPTAIDHTRYPIARVNRSTDDSRIVLVWIGSTSTSKYLLGILGTIREVQKKFPNVWLRNISDFQISEAGLRVENISWNQSSEVHYLSSSHIGIAPQPDDMWTRGKCALKIIQYMAARLPVVSSASGANKGVVVDGETGFLVHSEAEWIKRVIELVREEKLRIKMGDAGYERYRISYSLQQTNKEWITLLNNHK
jgi:glycosyltransferase involved in cell wall biosynthesis